MLNHIYKNKILLSLSKLLVKTISLKIQLISINFIESRHGHRGGGERGVWYYPNLSFDMFYSYGRFSAEELLIIVVCSKKGCIYIFHGTYKTT